MKLSTIAKEIEATLYGEDLKFHTLTIDSRKIQKGDTFVAIKGEQYDGHDFIQEAIKAGASSIIAKTPPSTIPPMASFLVVDDPVIALGKLAALWRENYSVPLIGITGSCGKTTVKAMTQAICELQGKTLATKGNYNNHLGLPLTLLALDATYEHAIIEMGANHPGEIRYLGHIAKPSIAVITNVNPAHLQGFGSLQGVANAKGEIYEVLSPEGIAIVNREDPFYLQWQKIIYPRKMLTFGLSPEANVYATNIQQRSDSVQFLLHIINAADAYPVQINIPGLHTVMNALAAATCAHALGVKIEKIVEGLAGFKGVAGRLRRFVGMNGSVVIDDSYNANPGSMNAALEVLAEFDGERRFVMGDMGELGEKTLAYHMEIGKKALNLGIEKLFTVGTFSEHAAKAFGDGARHFTTKEDLIADLKTSLHSQVIILVKGSRSAGMEVVTNALIESN